MSDIRQARKALIKRILEGDGRASQNDRRAAFDNSLIDKVARQAHKITDADVSAAPAWGLSEDQVFEIVVCGAIGQAARQYEGALATLEVATEES